MTDEATTDETMTSEDLHTARVATLRLLFADETDMAAIARALSEAFNGKIEVDAPGVKYLACQELDEIKSHLSHTFMLLRGYV
jgi:uncharacterized membrane protein